MDYVGNHFYWTSSPNVKGIRVKRRYRLHRSNTTITTELLILCTGRNSARKIRNQRLGIFFIQQTTLLQKREGNSIKKLVTNNEYHSIHIVVYIIIRFRLVYCWTLNWKSIKAMAAFIDLLFGRQNDIIPSIMSPFSEQFHGLIGVKLWHKIVVNNPFWFGWGWWENSDVLIELSE